MAVVEIAKIQIRRGDARTDAGMPQLDTGELGWAISGTDPDSTNPELYIGNNVADGAPVTTNTRILTELDLPNIFNSSVTTSTYVYKGHRSVAVYTGPGGLDLLRNVQEKLDDSVSLRDFLTDDDIASDDYTSAIQRAVNQLFLNADKSAPAGRVTLKIPAGLYNITNTIYIPPYANIVGDGKEKTIISLSSASKSAFQFVDLNSSDGDPVEFDDLFGSQTSPRYITLSGMTVKYSPVVNPNNALPLLRADCGLDVIVDDIRFFGTPSYSSSNAFNTGIEIRGQGGISSRNLRITNCIFENLYSGILSNYDIEDTVIDNNKFQNLYTGISFGVALVSANNIGPVRARITRNIFYIIALESIKVGGDTTKYTNHIISQNIHNNVGNDAVLGNPGAGDIGGAVTPVVNIQTMGNVIDNDYFSRFTAINNYSSPTNFIIPISGHASIVDNKVRLVELLSYVATGTVVKVGHTGTVTNIKIQYHLTSSGITRWGELTVVCSGTSIVDVTDNYKFTGTSDSGIIFDATYDDPNTTITVSYSGNTVDGQVTYQLNQYY